MQCKVDGCGREANYKAAQLCQMHYFRQWRYGTTDTTRKGKARPRVEMPNGYQWVYRPEHPLAHRNRYVPEHRAVVYDSWDGRPLACELCGVSLTWKSCRVDHIDNNPRNNERSNLRPTCNTCNTQRGVGPAVTWSRTSKIEFGGVVLTAHEWSRDPRVSITSPTILRRLRSGMTPEDALFSRKRTHNTYAARKPAPTKREQRKSKHDYLHD